MDILVIVLLILVIFGIPMWTARVQCPNCQTKQPKYKLPKSWKDLFLGYTCPKCGCEFDKNGKKLS